MSQQSVMPLEEPGQEQAIVSEAIPETTYNAGEIYRQGVYTEVSAHGEYFVRQMTRYRRARIVVIVSAALVPILSPIDSLPRWVLGGLGGLAAVMESLNQLYRWRDTAVSAEKTGNQLEAELNRYGTSTGPYVDDATALERFVDRVERIRAQGSDAFAGLWSEDRPPSSQSGP